MSRLQQLQRFLPVGALGISLILHLAIFLGISGIILIQAVAPRIIPSGEYSNNASSPDLPPPPDLPDDIQDTPNPTTTDDAALEAPQTPTFSIEQISAANASHAPAFVIAPPTSLPLGATTENPNEGAPPKVTNADRKTSNVIRTMSNPFGNLANPDDGGMIGYLYDFKQTTDRKPSSMAGNPEGQAKARALMAKIQQLKDSGAKGKDAEIKKLEDEAKALSAAEGKANGDYRAAVTKYVTSGWPEKPAGNFYQTERPLGIYQLFIPSMLADEAPAAFKVGHFVKPRRWIVVYRGAFTAPESGTFRFVGLCDDIMVVNFRGKNVLDGSLGPVTRNEIPREQFSKFSNNVHHVLWAGSWFQLEAGQSYPLKILIGEHPGGIFYAFLLIQKKGDDSTTLPVFQLSPTNLPKNYEPGKNAPPVAKKPFVCQ
jgi:hypothetical protein